MSDTLTIRTEMQPFGLLTSCPKCEADLRRHPPDVKYSEYRVVASGCTDQPFVPIHTRGEPLWPHLEKQCDCGYAWIEATADTRPSPSRVARDV